jgi:hypothetical protein
MSAWPHWGPSTVDFINLPSCHSVCDTLLLLLLLLLMNALFVE